MIYKLTNKQIKRKMKEFMNTTYGKITFLLSYSVPFVTMLFFISFTVSLFSKYKNNLFVVLHYFGPTMIFGFLFFLTSFVLGSMYYYLKLEKFIDKK